MKAKPTWKTGLFEAVSVGVRIKRIHPDAVLPRYQTEGSAGFDFHAVEDVTIKPGQLALVRTGLAIGAPQGYMLMACPRSSTYKNFGLVMVNSVGVIDSDYSGNEDEILLPLMNVREYDSYIKKGTRFAQAVFVQIGRFAFHETDDMGASRGGWGSTGI